MFLANQQNMSFFPKIVIGENRPKYVKTIFFTIFAHFAITQLQIDSIQAWYKYSFVICSVQYL